MEKKKGCEWRQPCGTPPINYTKGYIKGTLSFLMNNNMNNTKPHPIKKLLGLICSLVSGSIAKTKKQDLLKKLLLELYELADRDYMNDPLYLFSRRQKALVCRILLEDLKESNDIEQEMYDNIKTTLMHIMLENWTRQLLPDTSGIIPASQHKTESYMNYHTGKNKKVLEPREYIGIVPEAFSDLDAPSLVTALTPPGYEQPRHDHANNREITFYTGPSIAKYKTNGVEHTIHVNFGEFVIFPPGTRHTIKNPNDFAVKNMSIKLPSALLDRGKTYNNAQGSGELKKMEKKKDGIYEAHFEDQNVPYFCRLYRFDEQNEFTIQPNEKALLYIIDGDFIVSGLNKPQVVRGSDAIVLDKDKSITIKSLNGTGNVYMIHLTDGWDGTNEK